MNANRLLGRVLPARAQHTLVTARDRGTATAEYAIATLAACGFGGVLLALLRSGEAKTLLTGIIRRALTVG
jgi:hypothetical protein